MHKKLEQCRICQSSSLVSLLSLGNMSLTGIFPKSPTEKVPAGPLELVKCPQCDLVQLGHSYDLSQLYGQNYGYRSGLNSAMVRHLNSKVDAILKKVDLSPGDLVIDVGSNDSTTLRAYPERSLQLVGVDPSGEKFRSWYPSHVQLIVDFFSASVLKDKIGSKKAKVVTSFSMFYDLENPSLFMSEVSDVLADDGIWVFEQSYLKLMLETNSYDTICHEHLEYYGVKQVHAMADRAGLKIVDIEFNDVNGGSFSVIAAKKESKYPENKEQLEAILNDEEKIGLYSQRTFKDFAERIEAHRQGVRKFLDQAKHDGKKVLGYGASTKGNVLLQHCQVTSEDLTCIAEVNEDKFGAFTPGTQIPILSEAEVRRMRPDYLFVLPWHFRAGIVQREKTFLSQGGHLVFPLPLLYIV